MKFPQLFGLMAAAHAGLIGILFIQPGCSSNDAPAPQPTTTLPNANSTAVRSVPSAATTSATPRSQVLDPVFNGGLPASGTSSQNFTTNPAASTRPGFYPPRRPDGTTASTTPVTTPTSPTTRTTQPVLQPVLNPELNHTSSTSTTPASARPDSGTPRTYTVVKGDSLSKIAKNQGTTVAALKATNNLKNDTIRIGQELIIPEDGATMTILPAQVQTVRANEPVKQLANGQEYTIEKGDSLSKIAAKFGTTVGAIKRANNMSSDRIIAGKTLIIPAPGTEPKADPKPETKPAPKPAAKPATTTSSGDAAKLKPVESAPTIIGSGSTAPAQVTADELDSMDIPAVPVQTTPAPESK